jgi:hypothetical protein
MKTDTYTKFILTIIAICLVVLILQGGSNNAVAKEPSGNNGNYAIVPINPDGSINVTIKSIVAGQEVIIVGWKEKFIDHVNDLEDRPLPVKCR